MANANRPAGLIPYRHMAGGIPMRLGAYSIVSGQTGALFQGDPVMLRGAGGVGREIIISPVTAAITSLVLGPFVGVQYTAVDGSIVYSNQWVSATVMKTGTTGIAYVYDDPDMLYIIQTSTLATADIGAGAQLVIGTGNTQTGISGCTLGAAAAPGINQMQILELLNSPDNEFGANAKAVVRIITQQYRSLTGTTN